MSAIATDTECATAAIIVLNQQWETHFTNRDAAGLAQLFTEDCIRMPNGGPTTVGRQALETAYQQEFAEVWQTTFHLAITTDEVVVSGEYAFARGTDTLTVEEHGQHVQETGKWMATYRWQAVGAWRYFWSTSNSNR